MWEPYTHTCYDLVASLGWDCDLDLDLDAPAYLKCLCDIPEFNYLARTCLENTTFQLCPTPLEFKTIIPSPFSSSQISDAVALTAAAQSLDATRLNRDRADRYSNAVLLYWIIVMALYTATNLWLWLHPKSYMACSKRVRLLCKLQFKLPALEIIVLVGFVVLQLCVMLVNIPLVLVHVSLPLPAQQLLKHVGDRNAYMGIKLLPLVVYLGGRNGFLMTLTGWTVDRINVVHRWLGRVMLLNLCIHGLCYFAVKLSLGTYTEAMRGPTFQLGTAALLVFVLLGLQSLRVCRRFHYELFIMFHICFWVSLLVIGYLHTRKSWGSSWFLAALGIWALDHVVRGLKIVLNGSLQKVSVIVHSNKVVELLVPMENHEDHCGTFAYVHFSNLGWWQSHPFSYFCDGEYMRFFVRPRAGLTSALGRLALYKSPKVMIDGPYGTRPNLDCFESVLFVVAGIGITSTIGYLRSLARLNPNKTVCLHWAVRTLADLELAATVLRCIPGNTLVTIYLSSRRSLTSVEQLNDSSEKDYLSRLHYCVLTSRMCVSEVVSSSLHSGPHSSVAVIVCGPDQMMVEARAAVSESFDNCAKHVELYEHKYSW